MRLMIFLAISALGAASALARGCGRLASRVRICAERLLGLSRFNVKYSAGTLPHATLMRSIELFGTVVAPRVRAEINQ